MQLHHDPICRFKQVYIDISSICLADKASLRCNQAGINSAISVLDMLQGVYLGIMTQTDQQLRRFGGQIGFMMFHLKQKKNGNWTFFVVISQDATVTMGDELFVANSTTAIKDRI